MRKAMKRCGKRKNKVVFEGRGEAIKSLSNQRDKVQAGYTE